MDVCLQSSHLSLELPPADMSGDSLLCVWGRLGILTTLSAWMNTEAIRTLSGMPSLLADHLGMGFNLI